jgi:DNA-binding LacI/PurR family transcriptional regulator
LPLSKDYDVPLVAEYTIKSDSHITITKQLFSTKPYLDVFIAFSNQIAPLVIKFLRSRGIAIPQDTIVTGFDEPHRDLTDNY